MIMILLSRITLLIMILPMSRSTLLIMIMILLSRITLLIMILPMPRSTLLDG